MLLSPRRYAAATSDEANADRLRSLGALDHVDSNPLAFRKLGDAAAGKRRDMYENVLATAVPDNESKPLIGIVPLHRAALLDGGLIGGPIRPLGPRAPRRLLERGAR